MATRRTCALALLITWYYSFGAAAKVAQQPPPCPKGARYLGHIVQRTTPGAYIGMTGNFAEYAYNLEKYTQKLGMAPAAFQHFVFFPTNPKIRRNLRKFLQQVASMRAIAILTVEPMKGLDTYTDKDIDILSADILRYQQRGASVIIRFAHEMNGAWFPWAQRPLQYRNAWKRFVARMRPNTCRTAFLWSPNEGLAYPYGQTWSGRDRSDIVMMDTNKDGKVTAVDNPYAPYWPGSGWVDFVGMSNFHMGNLYPQFDNGIPENRKFSNKILGAYKGWMGDGRMVPDFYHTYAVQKSKPMIIPETAAWYSRKFKDPPGVPRYDVELKVKRSWWEQVFNAQGDREQALDIPTHFPFIKIIMWFDIKKEEVPANNALVDMTVSSDRNIRNAFHAHLLKSKYWKFLGDYRADQAAAARPAATVGKASGASRAGKVVVKRRKSATPAKPKAAAKPKAKKRAPVGKPRKRTG